MKDSAISTRKLNLSFPTNTEEEISYPYFPVIKSIHSYRLDKKLRKETIKLSSWAIEYHSKFSGDIILPNGERYQRTQDSIHLYASGIKYYEDTSNADLPIQETYILFHADPKTDIYQLTGKNKFAIFPNANKIGKSIKSIVNKCHLRGTDATLAAQSGLLSIIDSLLHAKEHSKNIYTLNPIIEKQLSFSDEVEKFLQQRLSDKTTNADIARYMKVSESTLNHKFKKETDTSPLHRLIELRINFAKTLLIKGNPLKIIADMTGFGDEFHLSKTFRKITKQSTREFLMKFQ